MDDEFESAQYGYCGVLIDNTNTLCFLSGQKVYFLNFLVHLSVTLKMNFDESATIQSGMIELVIDTMTLGNVQRVLFWSLQARKTWFVSARQLRAKSLMHDSCCLLSPKKDLRCLTFFKKTGLPKLNNHDVVMFRLARCPSPQRLSAKN